MRILKGMSLMIKMETHTDEQWAEYPRSRWPPRSAGRVCREGEFPKCFEREARGEGVKCLKKIFRKF